MDSLLSSLIDVVKSRRCCRERRGSLVVIIVFCSLLVVGWKRIGGVSLLLLIVIVGILIGFSILLVLWLGVVVLIGGYWMRNRHCVYTQILIFISISTV